MYAIWSYVKRTRRSPPDIQLNGGQIHAMITGGDVSIMQEYCIYFYVNTQVHRCIQIHHIHIFIGIYDKIIRVYIYIYLYVCTYRDNVHICSHLISSPSSKILGHRYCKFQSQTDVWGVRTFSNGEKHCLFESAYLRSMKN